MTIHMKMVNKSANLLDFIIHVHCIIAVFLPSHKICGLVYIYTGIHVYTMYVCMHAKNAYSSNIAGVTMGGNAKISEAIMYMYICHSRK